MWQRIFKKNLIYPIRTGGGGGGIYDPLPCTYLRISLQIHVRAPLTTKMDSFSKSRDVLYLNLRGPDQVALDHPVCVSVPITVVRYKLSRPTMPHSKSRWGAPCAVLWHERLLLFPSSRPGRIETLGQSSWTIYSLGLVRQRHFDTVVL